MLGLIVVEDDQFVREMVTRLLNHQSGRYQVLAAVENVEVGVSACREHCPDVILLDINLPGENGIDGLPKLKAVCAAVRVLLCTAQPTDERIIEALRSGADGFIEKTGSWDELTVAIDRVAAGDHYICPRSTAALVRFSRGDAPITFQQQQLKSLTKREGEIVALVSRGRASKEIADSLGLSVSTVDVHRANVMKKLGLRNAAALVAFAFQAGLMR